MNDSFGTAMLDISLRREKSSVHSFFNHDNLIPDGMCFKTTSISKRLMAAKEGRTDHGSMRLCSFALSFG